jgi:dTDP-4-amino-4,6-dideoxygalactose transaminase
VEDGFNGKLTEVHAALGIVNLKYYDDVLNYRKAKYKQYIDALSNILSLKFQKIKQGTTNYSYFPIIFESEVQLLKIENALNEENVFPRRYFYPSINTYTNIVEYQKCPVSEDIAKRILCLPLYRKLTKYELTKTIQVISDLIH